MSRCQHKITKISNDPQLSCPTLLNSAKLFKEIQSIHLEYITCPAIEVSVGDDIDYSVTKSRQLLSGIDLPALNHFKPFPALRRLRMISCC